MKSREGRKNPILEKRPLKNLDLSQVGEVLKKVGESRLAHLLMDRVLLRENQPRRYFDEEEIARLASSIRHRGLLQPIIVRPIGGDRYQIVAGERRFRAFQKLRKASIPAIIVEFTDEEAQAAAILENLQREDLNPLEETEAILDLLAMRLGREPGEVVRLMHRLSMKRRKGSDNVIRSEESEVVERTFRELGRMTPESFRLNRLPLLNLPADVLEELRRGRINYTKARAIARVKDDTIRKELLKRATEEGWSLPLVRAEVREHLQAREVKPRPVAEKAKSLLKKLRWGELPPEKEKRALKILDELERLIESA